MICVVDGCIIWERVYYLRKGDLFVPSWVRVHRVRLLPGILGWGYAQCACYTMWYSTSCLLLGSWGGKHMFVFCQDLHASDSFHSTHPDSVVLQWGWYLSAEKCYVVWLYTGRQHRWICVVLLLFNFLSMFISFWVSCLKIAEFLDSVRRPAP